MNDLRNGIIDIEGVLIGPDTSLEELRNLKIDSKDLSPCPSILFDSKEQSFLLDDMKFRIRISFDVDNNRIRKIELEPDFPDIRNKYDFDDYPDALLNYYKELRVPMDQWLEKQLGQPTYKDEDVTEYDFNNIFIGISAYMVNTKSLNVFGGKVNIRYDL